MANYRYKVAQQVSRICSSCKLKIFTCLPTKEYLSPPDSMRIKLLGTAITDLQHTLKETPGGMRHSVL